MTRDNDRGSRYGADRPKITGDDGQAIRSIQQYGADGACELILVEIEDPTETIASEDGTRWIQSDTFEEVKP